MIESVWVRALLKAFVLPPVGLWLPIAFGLVAMRRSPRLGRTLAWGGLIVQLLLAMPAVAIFLVRTLDASPPLDLTQPPDAQAIVILGGGTRRDAPEYGGDTLAPLTLERVRYGAYVARRLSVPVLVSGGAPYGGTPEAILMRETLQDEMGVGVRWIEPRSRTTHENAQRSARILQENGIRRVVLVVHAFDVPRARAEFARAGIDIVPAPTGIPKPRPDSFVDFVPNMGAAQTSYYAVYELLANAMLRLSPHP